PFGNSVEAKMIKAPTWPAARSIMTCGQVSERLRCTQSDTTGSSAVTRPFPAAVSGLRTGPADSHSRPLVAGYREAIGSRRRVPARCHVMAGYGGFDGDLGVSRPEADLAVSHL